MGFNLTKRLAEIEKQVEGTQQGRIGFFRALILSFIVLSLISAFLPDLEFDAVQSTGSELGASKSGANVDDETARLLERLNIPQGSRRVETPPPDEDTPEAEWRNKTSQLVNARVAWLKSTWIRSGAGESYYEFSKSVVQNFLGEPEVVDGEVVDSWQRMFERRIAGGILSVGFLIYGFWPLWLVALVLSYFVFKWFFLPKRTDDVLGVCTPGHGPFYSGIYGPLSPNNGISGTDRFAPNLACPKSLKPHQVIKHELGGLLRKYGALNETNLALVGTVLAYPHYPGFVEDERADEDPPDTNGNLGSSDSESVQHTGLIRPSEYTLERGTRIGLRAVLEAHRGLVRLFRTEVAQQAAEQDYGKYLAVLEKLGQQMSPSGAVLLKALTPARAKAIAVLPTPLVASAYLATEAGKSLVFKEIEGGFSQISRFPHLQARAVLQSIVNYYQDYNGDQRLYVRQAIVCARRHGDFGRAFLPYNMPLGASAIRDWLEILYELEADREETGLLVELNGHIAEIRDNWRKVYATRLAASVEDAASAENQGESALMIWKGFPYQSVILMPLKDVVEVSLAGVGDSLLSRITHLIGATRARQSRLSISARLPGFKRQAEEATKGGIESGGVTKLLAESKTGDELVRKWLIVRRMLTRYNWLSTRIGDDAVPVDGLVQAVVTSRTSEAEQRIGLDALVPLRQRRLKEMVGEDWERTYYLDAPHPNDIKLYVTNDEFVKGLKHKVAGEEESDPTDDQNGGETSASAA